MKRQVEIVYAWTKKDCIVVTTFAISFLILGILFGFFFATDYELQNDIKKMFYEEQEIVPLKHCENKSFIDTTECLNRYINNIFNFTVRSDTPKSVEDIIKNGGDCYDYSNVYVGLYKDLGYYSKGVTLINQNTNNGHMFVVAWDRDLTQYCIIDQTHIVGCANLIF